MRELARPFKMAKPDVEVIRDINYTAGGKRARLDIYRPKGVDLENAPVLVQVHGGGWTIGTKEQQGLLLMNRMAAARLGLRGDELPAGAQAPVPGADRRREEGDRLDAREHRRLRRGPVVPRRHRRLAPAVTWPRWRP